ncbi:competence/damage-inducible protein A [Paraferrimonas haliotis]|uniref:CinA-like protein n=1 Tax=Paraferrimonas haliotis TaxID=2013866 RepID=A0AA37TVL8_9GAMM|nr:competence/damage-inducible protein A [Paraferrimonas haliotis]GLS83545.1 nicotinamide-nucleotide amidohydrolase PncC [Paraferrimonas haliotis]
MKIELICTGEEVLSGQIVDTNASWFANCLLDNGFELSRKTTVGDRMEDLISVFQERSKTADVIVVNGGLGPTEDDLSAQAAAQACGVPLVVNEPWLELMSQWFARSGRVMAANNKKQAMLPEGAVMIENPVGTACGFRIKLNNAWLLFTPGVPHEFKRMIHDHLLPFVRSQRSSRTPVKLAKLMTFGEGESQLASRLDSVTLSDGIDIGYRASSPQLEVKIFARTDAAIAKLDETTKKVKQQIGESFFGEGGHTLAECIHKQLIKSGVTIAAAESCTGGLLASQLVAFPGSSRYLQSSIVSYSNQAKKTLLGVSSDTLELHGAVSKQTAAEMALGVRQIMDTDYGLSVTGIAGPEGGSDDKPVGTVCIGLSTRNQVFTQRLQFGNRSRTWIRNMSCAVAYDMLRRAIAGQFPIADYPMLKRIS